MEEQTRNDEAIAHLLAQQWETEDAQQESQVPHYHGLGFVTHIDDDVAAQV